MHTAIRRAGAAGTRMPPAWPASASAAPPLTLTGPATCAVVLRGIDLFGYPTAEVSDAFSDSLPPTLRLSGGGLYLTSVSVHAKSVPAES